MPRIDDIKVQEKVFKKKEYRSWDGNLLEKLKLTDDKDDSGHISSNQGKDKAVRNTKSDNKSPNPKTDTPSNGKLGFNKGSNEVQLESNQGSDKVQQGFNKGSNEVQLESNQGSDKVQLNPNIGVQLGFVSDRVLVQKLIRKLGGNEKKIFFYVVDICSIKGSLSTSEIIGETLTSAVATTRNGRETAIKRLSKKGLLKRKRGKTGTNGTLCLHISELIKTEALNYLNMHASEQALLSNRVQQYSSNEVQLGSSSDVYSSSSNSININTTTKNKELPEIWLDINFEPLKEIGFSLTQLKQLHSKNLNTPDIIQESINHFSYGLENNPKIKKYPEPLNVLMGVLRKGQAWVEPNYQSPQEIAQRQLIERKKIERDRLKRLEEEAYKLALDEWKDTITAEQLEEIAPSKKARGDCRPQQVKVSMYFRENIWPDKKNEYLCENS